MCARLCVGGCVVVEAPLPDAWCPPQPCTSLSLRIELLICCVTVMGNHQAFLGSPQESSGCPFWEHV